MQQLCLPIARRDEVIHTAHDICHQGYKRTKEKLRLHFCGQICQLKNHHGVCGYLFSFSEKTKAVIKDRVPISVVPRDQVPFSHLYMDVIEPLLDKTEYNLNFVCG